MFRLAWLWKKKEEKKAESKPTGVVRTYPPCDGGVSFPAYDSLPPHFSSIYHSDTFHGTASEPVDYAGGCSSDSGSSDSGSCGGSE